MGGQNPNQIYTLLLNFFQHIFRFHRINGERSWRSLVHNLHKNTEK